MCDEYSTLHQKDLLSPEEVDQWLRFYEMKAPLTCLSVFISKDDSIVILGVPNDLLVNAGFRLEHTHFFSQHGDGGHYHYDVTPEDVEYEGYFIPCHKAYRISPPVINPSRTTFFKK